MSEPARPAAGDVPTTPKTPLVVASPKSGPPLEKPAQEFDLVTVVLGLAILLVAVYGFRRGRKPPPDKRKDSS
jgi:hypothetical protein